MTDGDHEESGHFCKSCGSRVDAQGYATGGEVEAQPDGLHDQFNVPEILPNVVGNESTQHESGNRMRERAFAKSLRGKR